MTLRHRLIVLGACAVAATGMPACGDDESPPPQAVLWFGLDAPAGASCQSIQNYQFPETARATVSGSSGVGDRVEDSGENLVECSVVESAPGSYAVNLRFQGGAVGNFIAAGTATATSGEFDVNFVTAQFAIEQEGCTGSIEAIKAGAVWIKNLSCSGLRDASSPNFTCTGFGGVIFENCGR